MNGDVCMPKCDPPCENSDCVLPQVCKCKTGHTRSSYNESVCNPICHNECINGDCVGVDTCSCHKGFKLDSDGHICHPVCDKDCDKGNAYCASPNVCECKAGYREIPDENRTSSDEICEYICREPCVNGRCIAPDTCQCNPNHYLSVESIFYCKPKCSKRCVNSNCTAVDTCTCFENYEKPVERSKRSPYYYDRYGRLVYGTTTTESPYYYDSWGNRIYHTTTTTTTKKPIEYYVCQPKCNPPCENGECIGINVCKCYSDYEPSNNTYSCKPKCTKKCVNAECSAPDVCTCLPGFEKPSYYFDGYDPNRGYHRNEWRVNETSPICNATCHPSCENGNCIDVDLCKCNNGYKLAENSTTKCIPICDPPCQNGECVNPSECRCHENYEKISRYSCRPRCNGCENGVCTSPNKCECNFGYSYDRYTGNCKPVCHECIGGSCVAPGVCRCYDDHVFVNDKLTVCEPSCPDSCIETGGFCQEPNKCTCPSGYERSEPRYDSCHPVCSDGCKFGNCTEPNVCICFEGYAKDSTGICRSECLECGEAKCIGPGSSGIICECSEGFVFDKAQRKCRSECEMCKGSECNLIAACDCQEGLERHSNGSCVKSCLKKCGRGSCDFEKLQCVCDFGYSGDSCEDVSVCAVYFDKNAIQLSK